MFSVYVCIIIFLTYLSLFLLYQLDFFILLSYLSTLCLLLAVRKHWYGKNPAIPVPGASWVRILLGYRYMRTPGVPVFGLKKKFTGTVLVRVRYGSGRVRGKAKTVSF